MGSTSRDDGVPTLQAASAPGMARLDLSKGLAPHYYFNFGYFSPAPHLPPRASAPPSLSRTPPHTPHQLTHVLLHLPYTVCVSVHTECVCTHVL